MITANICPSVLTKSINWDNYLKFTNEILTSSQRPEIYQDEKYLKYTQDNLDRMNHVIQFAQIQPKLYNLITAIQRKMIWMVITEPWCGDASQSVPLFQLMASINPNIELRLLLRDENLTVMDEYLTDGKRAIPKVIFLDASSFEELGVWGPRPQLLQNMVDIHLDDKSLSFGDKVRMVHSWYENDKTNAIQTEMISIIKSWNLSV